MFGDELLQLVPDDRALGLPKHQALADHFIDVEQAQSPADHTMVAGFGFFEGFHMNAKIRFGEESGSVNALKAIGRHIAVPVGSGDGHELHRADARHAIDVGSLTKVFPVHVLLTRDIPRQHRRTAFDGPLGIVDLVFVALGVQSLHARSRI